MPRAVNKLTAVALRNPKPGKHADGLGLYVEATATGAKLWRLKYRFGGKEKRLALGAYPDVGIAEARARRDAARAQLRDGTTNHPRNTTVLRCTRQVRRLQVDRMRKTAKLVLSMAIGILCAGCVSVPSPRIPSGAPSPYTSSPSHTAPATVPADFPNPARDRRVCKQVQTDQGSQRVCMWEPRH